MNNGIRLGILALFVAILMPASLSAHEAHQDNMSDEEMAMMDAGFTDESTVHGIAEANLTKQSAEGSANTPVSTPELVMQQIIEDNRLTSGTDLLSRLHPFAAHFPIALLIVAAMAEFAIMLRPNLGLHSTVRFLVAGGAIGAVATALFGWFAGGWRLADRSETLAIHRWNGTTIAMLSILAWWLAARDRGRWRLRLILTIMAIGLLIQGYYGGEMVHGPNHMGVM